MPRPVDKNEQDLREWEIMDAARADVDLVVKDFRRRILSKALPRLIDGYREQVSDGYLPAINAEYRELIREFVTETARELEERNA